MKPGIILSKPLLTPFRSYDEILPNLWLGNLNACLDKKFLKEKKIKAVVSLYSPKLNTNFFINKKIAIFQVQVKDNLSFKSNFVVFNNLDKILDFIHHYLQNNDGVLVHCHYGWQRSATVCAAYIMSTFNKSMIDSVNYIRNKRDLSFFPDVNFFIALRLFEKKLVNKQINK